MTRDSQIFTIHYCRREQEQEGGGAIETFKLNTIFSGTAKPLIQLCLLGSRLGSFLGKKSSCFYTLSTKLVILRHTIEKKSR